MDAKELQAIRAMSKERLDLQTVPALLDYIDALKADMEEIRKAAHQLTLMPSVRVAAAIYHIAARHADEPEDGA